MYIPKEIIFEIYSHLGNTDKRRLRQTATKYDIKFKEKDLLEELIEDGYDIPEKYYYTDLVVKYGRLDIVSKIKIDLLCSLAAKYGQLKILIWARENGYFWCENTCRYAAQGHLACLKYLHEQGCPWDEWTCRLAARGYLECLKYAHEKGCPWDVWVCENAARGHLECLKYLHEHGCPWDESTCINAAARYLDCLDYILDKT